MALNRNHTGRPAQLDACLTVALTVMAALIIAAGAWSLAESYRGLRDWAVTHDLPAVPWGDGWPLMVDTFMVVGELAVFVAIVLAWPKRYRAGGWTLALAGLAVSVAGNVAHLTGTVTLADRLGAAVPPVAAASILAVGLGVLKRIAAPHGDAARAGSVFDVLAYAPPAEPARRTAKRVTPHRPPAPRTRADLGAARKYLRSLDGGELPTARALAVSHLAGNRRAAGTVLAEFAPRNGKDHASA